MSDYRPEWSAPPREPEPDERRDEPYEYDLAYLRGYEPIHPEPGWKALLRKLWVPIAAIGALLFKFKTAALAVFKFKFFASAASGLVSVAAYALLWDWWFAIGLVALLFIHELGHVLEARRQGLRVSAPMFIPFLGAYISLKDLPPNAWRDAQIALAGPIVGSVGAAAFWVVGELADSEFFVAMAYVGFFLNLLNLIPVIPFDGGRVASALHPVLWFVGLVALAGIAFVWPNPIVILILLVGLFEVWNRWKTRHTDEAAEYYSISPAQRVIVGITYLGTAALLAVAMGATYVEREL